MDKLNIKKFEKKLIVRKLELADWPLINELQQNCFPGMDTWCQEQYESQIRTFPEGQIGIELEGKLVASSSSLILNFELFKDWHNFDEISGNGYIKNHKDDGSTLYGIEIMVNSEFRGLKLSSRIYDARKELAVEKNLMRIVLGGRMPGYAAHADKWSPKEYLEQVGKKNAFDPVLTAQVANGFVLKRIIPNYLKDKESRGYAVFSEWMNLDYVPNSKQRYVPVAPARVCVVQYQLRMVKSFEEFADQCEYFVNVASSYDCDFILFPEMFTTQLLSLIETKHSSDAIRKLSDFTEQYLELFTGLAVRYNINIIGGSHFTVEDDSLYNISYLFRRDGTLGKQYKLHITPTERIEWGVQGGSKVEVFDTDCGKIAIQICYDIEFPEVSRIAVEQGAQIIFVPFCTDERYAYLRVRYCAQARCIENHVYVAIAGSVGNLPNIENIGIHYAQSAIFTPSDIPFTRDAIAAECTPNVETVVFEDLDIELLRKHKKTGSVLNWKDRRTDLYEIKYFSK